MIPNLLNDLHMIYKLDWKEENKDIPQDSTGEEWKGDNNDCQQSPRVSPVLDLDLNCLPYEEDEPELPNNEIEVECLQGSESMLSGFATMKGVGNYGVVNGKGKVVRKNLKPYKS
ncbi:protein RKD5 [Sesbania bispinosa]|nr:protein RKD5 [Sesbania bispinosa]